MAHTAAFVTISHKSLAGTRNSSRIAHLKTKQKKHIQNPIVDEVRLIPILCGRKEGNALFNDALNTFYLRLYGVGHMVKYHSDSERKPAAATWVNLSD